MNREVEGFVDLMWDATRRFDAPLTAERLFSWHRALFPEPGGMEVQSQELLADARRRADIENRLHRLSPNPRQRKVMGKFLFGFEGKLTSSKYAKMARCSQDTAIRDIKALVDANVLEPSRAGGRSRSYSLAE